MTSRIHFFTASLLLMTMFLFVTTPVTSLAQGFGDTIGDIIDETDEAVENILEPTVNEQYADIQQQGLIFAGICQSANTPCDCRDEGRCDLNDMLQVVVNITVFILGLTGSLVLIMFIYGGFTWLTSGGNTTRVKEGADTMKNAVIGLIIVFGAYTVITLLISVLKTGAVTESGQTLEDVIGGDAADVIDTKNR
jgi:ABC-type amino acid transport system permease subunit